MLTALLVAYTFTLGSCAVVVRAVATAAAPLRWTAYLVLAYAAYELVAEPFIAWRSDFSKRKHRWEQGCPSHVRRPNTGTRELAAESPRRLSARQPARWQLGSQRSTLSEADAVASTAGALSPLSRRLGVLASPLDRFRRQHSASETISTNARTGSHKRLDVAHAAHIPADWDHLPLTLTELLWARLFVYVPLAVQALSGMLRFATVLGLRRWRLLATPVRDPCASCFVLLLETSCAVFVAITPEEEKEEKEQASASPSTASSSCPCAESPAPCAITSRTARFEIPWAAKVMEDGDVHLGRLCGQLDLDARRLVQAEFDGEAIAPDDCFLLLWLALVSQNHPQIHAMANWGINHVASSEYLRCLGVTSIYFNHLGLRGFPRLCGALRRLGLLRVCTRVTGEQILGRAEQNPPTHKDIRKLEPHSKLVHFIVRVRGYFLMQFEKHRDDFRGVDGESLFLGTVLHSIDHEQASSLFDACDMTWHDPSFRGSYEIATLVSSGFVRELTLAQLMLDRRFSAGRHALFRDTYQFAKRIDARLADGMECAIIR